ncbi:sigma-70 family RNA polymerase sigma factor [Clostridium sp.]|uniref:sigma-70 family RNA polymerase sigma factor n=1 Tax=Clostridium sp. TaxID=1506 RepID=UPI00262C2F8B|nr:sigma-70 family RNA polymerase sigma factor [Clostridium sp.]
MIIIFGIPRLKNKRKQFEEIYMKYYPIVSKQISYLLGNHMIAEDLAQEVFIKYYYLENQEIEFLGAWFSKVATNIALNHMRGENRRMQREENVYKELEEIFIMEDDFIRNEEIKRVRKALSILNENQKICLLLKFSGYSYDEIHQITNIPKNNIGQCIARGKEKFKEIYEKEGEEYVL